MNHLFSFRPPLGRASCPRRLSPGRLIATTLGLLLVGVLPADAQTQEARFTRVGGIALGDYAYKVQVVGDLAYVANDLGGMKIINVSNPAEPVLVGAFATGVFANGATAQNLAVVGDRAYVGAAEDGLVILDVSNPAAPSYMGTYNTTGVAYAVQVAGNLAYVADSHAGLQIIDVADGSNPVRVGGFNTPGEAVDVHVVGNVAHVADAGFGLQLLDVTDPATPTRLGGDNTPGTAYAVQVVGNLAYVADGAAGFQVLDLSDPLNPSRVSTTTGVRAIDITVVEQRAYVAAAGVGGLLVYDVSTPANPLLLGGIGSGTEVYGVQVVGNRIFLANGLAGLQIFDVRWVQTQSLTWNLPATLAFTGQRLVLDATSTSGLPVTYSLLSGPATVQGNELTVTGPGRVTVRASQAGDSAYASATVDRTVAIGLPRMDAQTAGLAQEVSWAAGLNGLRLQGRESLAADTPWQQVTLPWVEANGQVRVNMETSPFRFFRLQGFSGQGEPLELTGWNRDVVLENALPSRATAFSSFGSAWFESGLGGRLDGLPTNRTFLSRVTPEVLFQFQPYTGFNTLWLNNTRRTNSLVLVTPSACSKLFVLAHSAGGGGNGTVRVHYADGTSSAPMPFFAPDWWDGSPASPTRRPAIQGLAWSTTVASFTYNQVAPGFSFHQTDLDLSTGPNAGKVITRLEFVKPAAPEVTGIYAVSGIAVPPSP